MMKKKMVVYLYVFMLMIVPVTIAIATDSGDISTPVDVVESDYDVGCLDDVTHLNEGFEDNTMPPEGWTVINTNPTKNWAIVHIDTLPNYVHSGDYAARVRDDVANEQDEWLISPEVEFVGGIVTLSFWAYSKTNPSPTTVEVHVMGDGFDDVVWDMLVNESWESYEYRQVSIDITRYNQETVKVAWRYIGQAGMKFGLDDILLFEGDPPDPCDIKLGRISGGGKLLQGGIIDIEIKNEGPGDATNVKWEVTVKGNGIRWRMNVSENDTIPLIAPSGLEIAHLELEPIFALLDITVTASENLFHTSDSKNATAFSFLFWVIILTQD